MIPPWLTVLTSPRRPEYLLDTLANLDRAGGARFPGNRVVFVDGDPQLVPAMPKGWVKLSTGGPFGTRRSMWRILHRAALARAPFLLYFEDDLCLCRNAVAAMAAIEVPRGVAFLAFLNQLAGVPEAPPGIYCRRADDPAIGHGFWGSQALKLPLRSLIHFQRPRTEPIQGWAYASDVWLGRRLATSSTPDHHFGIVVPALVRHVGERTAIPSQAGETLDGHRRGLNYAGDGFDAGTLPPVLRAFDLQG